MYVWDINNATFTLASIKMSALLVITQLLLIIRILRFNFAECLEVKYNNTLSLTDCGFVPV